MADVSQLNDALASNYMLVDIELRSWSGRRTDKEASNEVIANKGATKDSGRFVKFLFAGADAELSEVQKQGAAVRSFVYGSTLPWSGNSEGARRGSRLLPATQSFEFLKQLNLIKKDYDESVKKLVAVWPQRVAEAMRNLNDLADLADYPDASSVGDMFGVTVDIRPVPAIGDYRRINVPSDLADALGARHAEQAQVMLNNALADLKERILKELQRMSVQLGKAGSGEKTRLFDSLVTNMQTLVGLARTMNVTGNEDLNALADKIEKELLSSPVEVYRNSPTKASEVADAAKAIAVEAAMENIWKID